MKNKRLVIIGALVFFALLAVTGMAAAKSLYVIADINGYPTPINAYDIQGNTIVFQQTSYVPSYAGGAVGLAIDTDSKYLFVTYENSNVIQLVNATSMTGEGSTTAPAASNLAGILVDQDKQKIYTIDRSTNHLYVYSWDSSNKALTLDGGTYISLPGVSEAHGLALDESDDLLYIGDLTTQVKIFNTNDWSSVGGITVSQSVMGVALDLSNGFVYTGNAYPGYGSTGLLCKYDLNTDTETTLDIRVLTGDSNDNVVGLAVDPASSLLYITTGNQGSGGTDKIIILNSNLLSLGSTSDIGNPTGLCVPGKEISYNPLNLVKDDRVAEGNCVNPGGYINYSICFDNTGNTVNNVNIVDTLPQEVVFIQASNGGTYNAGTHKVTWNIGTLTQGQAQCEWLKVQVNLGTPPGTITNYATIDSDETPPTTQSEITTICEGVSDQDPPVTTKTIGFPQYGNGVWVTTKTPITLNAVDSGQNPSGVKEIHYKINGIETVVDDDHVTFNFAEECTHTLEFWAVDNAGNIENSTTQTHYVDDTGPVQTLQFGQPRIDNYIQYEGVWYTGIGANTPIWINSTDEGCDSGGVGSKSLTYQRWLGQEFGEWVFEETHTINDNGPGDSDPTVGRISVLTYMDESCWHEIHYWCYDLLDNRAPKAPGSYFNKDFVVDADEPTTTWWYEGPQYGEYISCATQKIIYATDTGCNPSGSGVYKIDWCVDKKMYDDEWEIVKSGTVYDNDANDLDQTVGKIKIAITVDEDCEHHIYHQAVDNFGNVGEIDKQYVKVDCTPPVTTKEIGNPKYYNSNEDITYVTTSTPIWLNTTDYTAPCAVGCEYLHWEIWLFNDDTQQWDLIDSGNEYDNNALIYFNEESYHKLVWWAIDYLGNQEETHTQYHKVDNTPPTTTKEYGYPQCPEEYPKLNGDSKICITSHTPIYLNATDGGECPVGSYTIYYRIWYNDQWSNWMYGAMSTNVVLTMNDLGAPWNQDCEHQIEYYAVDDLMNTEETHSQTFYVDNTPPVIQIQVGNPNCTIIPNQEYCITTQTDITIDSWNQGCCNNEYLYVEYKINDSEWTQITEFPITIRIPEECSHTLYVRARDCLGNEASKDIIFYVDETVPDITKVVGDPNYKIPGSDNYCITTDTQITLSATDQSCCQNTITIEYGYWYNDQWSGWITYTGPFSFGEECEHILYVRAYDCIGNGLGEQYWENETFYVDNTPPTINKFVGQPSHKIPDTDDYCVTTDTVITVEIEDESCCQCGYTVDYRIWYNGSWTEWTPYIEGISFNEECMHYLEIRASDCLGNENIENETFYVDDRAPQINKTVGEPNCPIAGTHDYCVTTDTEITVTSTDQGCCPGCDVILEYRIWYNNEWSDWTLYDGPISFEEECEHILEIRATDCLGNQKVESETFYVDETPPELGKTVGDPHFKMGIDEYGHEVWMVYPGTEICFTAQDRTCGPCGQDATIVYRIWYLGQWTEWMTYTTCITLTEGCVHYLEAKASDCLGNWCEVDNETFWVCAPGGGGSDDPNIEITFPEQGSTQSDNTVEVIIHAYDDETSWEELDVFLWVPGGRRDAPYLYYEVTPIDGQEDYYHAFVPIYNYQDGAQITLDAIALDEDGNTGAAVPVTFKVHSTIVWDQWMQNGWNSLTLPPEIGCEESVERVLSSINGSYDLVFYYIPLDGWVSYWTGDTENELTEMNSGKQYWVHITNEEGLRYYIGLPEIEILTPTDGATLPGLDEINGVAWDSQGGIQGVNLQIYYKDEINTKHYWDGSEWVIGAVDLPCNLVGDYAVSWSYDSSDVAWISGQTFYIKAIAYDTFGCLAIDMVTITIESQCAATITYTTNADFDLGTLDGVEHETIADQLQLIPGEATTYPVMWIANTGEDSLSKWDTDNNKEIARYHTWFGPLGSHGPYSGAAPSRTCVDSDGNCYVANRHFDYLPADVIKIYTDNWIDRNGNGVIDTSYDANNDGTITQDEMLPMTDTNGNNIIDDNEIVDERIAWAVAVGPYGGLGRSLAIDLDGNIWVGLFNSQVYYKLSGVDGSILAGPISVPVSPYGALVDQYGILWGASLGYSLLRLDTNTLAATSYYHGNYGSNYGIAIGYDASGNTQVYLGGNYYTYIQFDSGTNTFSVPAGIYYYTAGIATDSQGNICAENYYYGGASKFAPDGTVIWTSLSQYSGEYGCVVDSNDDVWVVHMATNKLSKFAGADGAHLGVFDTGLYPYTYSDAAGLGYANSINTGKWTVIHDSQAAATIWDQISWNADVPDGTELTVKVRSSEDQLAWSPWEEAENGVGLSATPDGKYIEIEVTFKAPVGEDSPVLYDLTVEGTCVGEPQCQPDFTMEKTVWHDDYWDEYTEADVGDIVTFNITVVIGSDSCPMLHGYLNDYLPVGLSYIPESTTIKFYHDGVLAYEISGEDCEPDITPGDGYNLLIWDSEQGYGENVPPNSIGYIEFNVDVIGCDDYTNTVNATGYYTCCDYIQDDDTAEVWVHCESNNPPNTPTNLEPTDGYTSATLDTNLYWTGGDQDAGDTVSYEIHFGTNSNITAIATVAYDNSTTIREYDLGTIEYNTQYYWYIIATDNHNSYSIGPTWSFTTIGN